MKKSLITLALLLLVLTSFAQDKGKRERIKALKIAFITEKLDLTTTEAQKFWPIYNAHELERDMMRMTLREKRSNLNVDTLSETEAKSVLTDMMAFEEERSQSKIDYIESLLTAIPAKKIILLKVSEDEFNERMLEEFKKRRGR
ncbi:hypothetical protein [Sediminibacter sp. Hel_I_10]|uniref:hypothetical protein n=1 Tax=Sediminibacter sp. Hel_I_10 TaxID=1392490 RepID=UPI00047B85C0|nr:hypothetical protein [Sediminibacter sp. Hel_I_10]